jgi:hypothetical protein
MARSVVLFLVACASLLAQPHLMDRWQRMSPRERARMLERMPPERRLELERRLRDMERIPPEARERLRREYDEFQALPEERKEAARRTLREINGLPPERRAAVRGAIFRLRQERAGAREDLMSSEAFTKRFDKDEQRLIREAVENLPPPPPRPPRGPRPPAPPRPEEELE